MKDRSRQTLKHCIYAGILGLFSTSVSAQVAISSSGNEISIGNQFISRTFSTAGNKLRCVKIDNKRTDTGSSAFRPGPESEEFVLSILSKTKEPIAIVRKDWKAIADSWCKDSPKGGAASYIIDGDASSFWHSNYRKDGSGKQELPHYFQIDMQRQQTIHSFAYRPRPAADNGRFADYELYVSDKATDIESPGNLVAKGELQTDGDKPCWINLDHAARGRYVRMKELSSQNGGTFGSCAEFYVSEGAYVSNKRILNSSAFSLNGAESVKTEDIQGGKRLTFDLQPVKLDGVDWDVDVVYEMKNKDHFMRKYLLISVPDSQRALARIDYVDMEYIDVNGAKDVWTHPAMGGGVGGMSGYHISLGQPVYIDGMFLGSEFPETENEISGHTAHVRYYSGKSIAELAGENRLNGKGQFATWKNVIGASRSTDDMDVIRSDFFAYINTIAKPIDLRLQYNSWFDWMMDITETNVLSSFKEMERGLTQNGVRPMDSYVVDDGWNAYGPYEKENTTGFWQFNSKFPNGLQKPSDFAHSVSSNFGIWLGPRGGYNYNDRFARFLEEHGNGTRNAANSDIVTGDKEYLKKLEAFFLKCQNDYGVNYWKLDGFCARPPQPSTNGRYISGGNHDMYYMTEHWERWAQLLDHLYANAAQRKNNLWINLTCYINPSPWILQWAKSVWMQVSDDIGRTKVDEGRTNDMDQLLTYRDDRYFDFIKTRQFQFPFSNIFNHDPSYGKTNCVAPHAMDDDQFRTYLYMMATRGAAFWELLYSYNLLDEGGKWLINAEVLNFLQKNYSILRHAKLIGDSPAGGHCYGYSCWNDEEGIISVRNPESRTQSFSIRLNRSIGVPETASNLWCSPVMSYPAGSGDKDCPKVFNYNDEITVNLKGGEVRIWKFSPENDRSPATLMTVQANAAGCDTVLVKFNEAVHPQKGSFKVRQEDKLYRPSSVTMLADNKTVCLAFPEGLEEGRSTLVYEGIDDWNENVARGSHSFSVCKNGIVWQAADVNAGKERKIKDTYIEGLGDFTVQTNLHGEKLTDGVLLEQPGAFSVRIVGGHVVFTVGHTLSVTSKQSVNDGNPHRVTCLRERNGMLKVYIDNRDVDNSIYDAGTVNAMLHASALKTGDKSLKDVRMDVKIINRALSFKEI